MLERITDEEVINANHPQRWKSAQAVFNTIKTERPWPHIAYKGGFPMESSIRMFPRFASFFILPGLRALSYKPEHYGLDNEMSQHSSYLNYHPNFEHFTLLLRGLVVRRLLELKCSTKLEGESWIEPPINDIEKLKNIEEQRREALLLARSQAASHEQAHLYDFALSELGQYGVGFFYYRLTAEGAKLKKTVKEKVASTVGEWQEV